MHEIVVDTQWLNERLNDPHVRVVEVDTSLETFKPSDRFYAALYFPTWYKNKT